MWVCSALLVAVDGKLLCDFPTVTFLCSWFRGALEQVVVDKEHMFASCWVLYPSTAQVHHLHQRMPICVT
jgi:hypothetical protein